MENYFGQQVQRKVSHFILGEEGKVGSRSAFTAAAFIGATSLAGILLSAPQADAGWVCGDLECHDYDKCCLCFDDTFDTCHKGSYDCRAPEYEPAPGVSCWTKW